MSDEQQDDQAPASVQPGTPEEPTLSARPGDTTQAPAGLAPSPGIAPPEVTPPPQYSAPPRYAPPEFKAPQFAPPQYTPPQYTPPQQPLEPPRYESPFAAQQQAQQVQQPQQAQAQAQAQAHPQQQQVQQPQQVQQVQPQPIPQQAQPVQQQPVQQQPAQHQPTQQQPYPAAPQYGEYAQPQKPGGSKSVKIVLAISAAVFVVLAVLFAVFASGLFKSPQPSSGAGSSSGESASVAAEAEEAVSDYFAAITLGDSATAMGFLEYEESGPLLNDEALEVSQELAPITQVAAHTLDVHSDYQTTVLAEVTIDDDTVEFEFNMWNFGEGWKIANGTTYVNVSQFAGLDLSINGLPVTDESLEVFPGTYEFELGNKSFELPADKSVMRLAAYEDVDALYQVYPQLTEAATTQFRELLEASLAECVASTALVTECGFDVSGKSYDGAEPIDGTVRRTLHPDTVAGLKTIEPEYSYSSNTEVMTYEYFDVETLVDATLDGQTLKDVPASSGVSLLPYVDFKDANPSVDWRY